MPDLLALTITGDTAVIEHDPADAGGGTYLYRYTPNGASSYQRIDDPEEFITEVATGPVWRTVTEQHYANMSELDAFRKGYAAGQDKGTS